jgi:hypothetical protein
MRKLFLSLAATASVIAAVPAQAVGLGDLAKVILGGKSVLKKAEDKCGTKSSLTATERAILDSAVEAARSSLTAAQFESLNNTSRAEAETASTSPEFCKETPKKKKGLLSKIGKAGKKIIGAKVLGL